MKAAVNECSDDKVKLASLPIVFWEHQGQRNTSSNKCCVYSEKLGVHALVVWAKVVT